MNARIPMLLGLTAVGLALATGLASPPAARADGKAADKVKEFQEFLKTNPDSQAIRNHIAELAQLHDPAVADALLPMLHNPKYDDDTKITVCQSVGKQGKKEVAGALGSFIDDKALKDKPKVIAAGLEGMGDADAKGSYKELIKTAKKYLDSNADIACAGFRAAANYVTRDTVDDLMKALETTDAALAANARSKQAPHDAARPVLMDILKKITGKDIGDVKIWKKWWDENGKTWEPPVAGKDKPKDINASEIFSDDAYAFEVKKPNKAWTFKKPETTPFLTLQADEEGSKAAWCDLFIQGTRNLKSKTPEALAKELRDVLEPKFSTIDKETEWEKPCSYGGIKGIEQIIKGRHKEFDACRIHNVFLVKNEIAFTFECVWKSGKKDSLLADIDTYLKSFKLTR